MSLIIEGIDMPTKDKAPLQFTVWSDGTVYCRDVIEKIETATAIRIPKGHGRLIDSDYIKAIYYEFSPTEVDAPEGAMAEVTELFDMRALDEAPTILDAEERHEL